MEETVRKHAPALIYSEDEAAKQMKAGVFTCRRCGKGIKWSESQSEYIEA